MTELVGGAGGLAWVAVKAVLVFAVAVVGFRGRYRAIIGRTATSSSTSFASGAVALVTLLVAHRAVSMVRRRGWLNGWVDSPPRVLIAHGGARDEALSRAGLTVTLVRAGDDVGPVLRAGLDAAGYESSPRHDEVA